MAFILFSFAFRLKNRLLELCTALRAELRCLSGSRLPAALRASYRSGFLGTATLAEITLVACLAA